jgi:hypothetical protein
MFFDSRAIREELRLGVTESVVGLLARLCCVSVSALELNRTKRKRPGKSPGLGLITYFRQCQYIRGQRKADID